MDIFVFLLLFIIKNKIIKIHTTNSINFGFFSYLSYRVFLVSIISDLQNKI